MSQPVVLKHSKRYHGLIVALHLAQNGRSVVLTCSKDEAPALRRRILEQNGGAWPFGVRTYPL